MNWSIVIDHITYANPCPPFRVLKTAEEWKKILTPEQYKITRLRKTERAHTGVLCNVFEDGKYVCANCKTALFDSLKKYNSNSGWPSFTEPIKFDLVKYLKDKSYGMLRVETACNICDAHLGHVFPDGPQPTGLRYCINSQAISLRKSQNNLINNMGFEFDIAKQIPYR